MGFSLSKFIAGAAGAGAVNILAQEKERVLAQREAAMMAFRQQERVAGQEFQSTQNELSRAQSQSNFDAGMEERTAGRLSDEEYRASVLAGNQADREATAQYRSDSLEVSQQNADLEKQIKELLLKSTERDYKNQEWLDETSSMINSMEEGPQREKLVEAFNRQANSKAPGKVTVVTDESGLEKRTRLVSSEGSQITGSMDIDRLDSQFSTDGAPVIKSLEDIGEAYKAGKITRLEAEQWYNKFSRK